MREEEEEEEEEEEVAAGETARACAVPNDMACANDDTWERAYVRALWVCRGSLALHTKDSDLFVCVL